MPGKFRSVMRWFHIIVALFVGSYFYSPLSEVSWSLPLIQFVLIPLVVASGVVMWQQAKVLRWFTAQK